MGVHAGDSITVPLPLPDRPRNRALRDASIAVLREIGVDTGGSEFNFCGRKMGVIVVEMNRISRSSGSKATGFPLQKCRQTGGRLSAGRAG